MHIHLIRTHYPHWGAYSGIHQFVEYLSTNCHVEMHLASDNDEDFPFKNQELRERLRRAVQKQGMQWYKLSDLTAEVKALQNSWLKRVDVIHYLDGEHSAQLLPKFYRLPRQVRPKMIATYHQPPELLDSLLDKKVISKLDLITVVSPEQVSYFENLTDAHKIRSILHGINTNYFKPGDKPKDAEKFKCITVGKYLRDFKALREVAEILSQHKNIEFYVVSSDAAEVEGLTNVTVYKGIEDASLLELYQRSHLLFLPLIQSTANNALLEGIACGLPVISTALPSVKAYVPDKAAILLKNNDPNQLADSILHLANNPQICKDMGLAARQRAEELDWQNIAPEYESIYSQLIKH